MQEDKEITCVNTGKRKVEDTEVKTTRTSPLPQQVTPYPEHEFVTILKVTLRFLNLVFRNHFPLSSSGPMSSQSPWTLEAFKRDN